MRRKLPTRPDLRTFLDKASEENRTESRNGCHERPSYFLAPAPPAAVPLASFILNFFFFWFLVTLFASAAAGSAAAPPDAVVGAVVVAASLSGAAAVDSFNSAAAAAVARRFRFFLDSGASAAEVAEAEGTGFGWS